MKDFPPVVAIFRPLCNSSGTSLSATAPSLGWKLVPSTHGPHCVMLLRARACTHVAPPRVEGLVASTWDSMKSVRSCRVIEKHEKTISLLLRVPTAKCFTSAGPKNFWCFRSRESISSCCTARSSMGCPLRLNVEGECNADMSSGVSPPVSQHPAPSA